MSKKDEIRIVFAAAPSQNDFLDEVAAAKGIDWSRVTAFHMDEYIGLPADAPQRFASYLRERLFNRVNPGKVHYIDGNAPVREECLRYQRLIAAAPLDIVCMGIGENGHIAFNDPPVADFHDPHVIKPVQLDLACRWQQVHDQCFRNLQDVPQQALTLTVPVLMSATFLYCMVPGSTKALAVKRTLEDPMTPDCPSTILRTHPNAHLFLDRDSYAMCL